MRNKSKILVTSILFSSINAYALFGGGAGGIVSDPTSYTYMAKEIKIMNDQLQTAVQTLDQMDKVNSAIDQANNLILKSGEKIYNPQKTIMGLFNKMQSTKSKFERLANDVQNMGAERFFKDFHNVKEPIRADLLKKWKANFNGLFDDKQDEKYQELQKKVKDSVESNNYKSYEKAISNLKEYLKLKKIEREALKKYSLMATMDLYNEYFINADRVKEREEQNQRILDYVDQIATSTTMHNQQQTTNLILIELLDFAKSQYEMQMKFFYAISMNGINTKTKVKYDIRKIIEEKENYQNEKSASSLKTPATKIFNNFIEDMTNKGKKSSYTERLEM